MWSHCDTGILILIINVLFCRDLQLEEYVDLYWRDYPSLISGFNESCLIDQGKMHLIVYYGIRKGNRQDML